MRKNIRGCFFFTAQSHKGEEGKKKKHTPRQKELKKQGVFFVSITVDENEIKRSPAERQGDR